MKNKLFQGGWFLFLCLCSVACAVGGQPLEKNEKQLALVLSGKITEANASWWGFDPEDSTNSLQAAINSGVNTLRIDRMISPWVCRPLHLASDQTILFEEGVELVAKKGEFKGTADSLLSAIKVKNVTLRGLGSGATLRMNKADYHTEAYKKAEWRHGLCLKSAELIRVENLSILSTGGDGIYLGVAQRGLPCKDIFIKKVICDDNNRQGISVISAVNLTIEDTILRNTKGTAPESGIDFEPNLADEALVNCVMRNCVCENNAGDGYQFYLPNLTKKSEPATILLENCISRENGRAGFTLTVGNGPEETLIGTMILRDCLFENDAKGFIIRSKSQDGLELAFENVHLVTKDHNTTNVAEIKDVPIHLIASPSDVLPLGNIRFTDLHIKCHHEIPWFRFIDASMEGFGLIAITGNVTLEQNEQRFSIILDEQWCRTNYPPVMTRRIDRIRPEQVDILPFAAPSDKPSLLKLRHAGTFLVYAKKGEEVCLSFREQAVGRAEPAGKEALVTGPDAKVKTYPLALSFQKDSEVSFKAELTGIYRVAITVGPHAIMLTRHNVPAVAQDGAFLKLVYCAGDFWFDVPVGTKEFGLRIVGQGAEKVTATLVTPTGNPCWRCENIEAMEAFITEEGTEPMPGRWNIRFEKPTQGVLEDFVVGLFGIPPYLRTSPDMILIER